jgi:hypothetical protein
VKWLVQQNLLDENNMSVVRSAITKFERLSTYHGIDVIPFSEELTLPESISESDVKVIPYGSTKLTKLAKQKNWSGVFFDDGAFRVDTWNKHHEDMLNKPLMIMKAKTVEPYFSQSWGAYPDKQFFVRPMEDLKAFAGGVMTVEQLANFLGGTTGNFSVADDCEVVISEVQDILAEWRFFIVGGKVIDGSMYRNHGRLLKKHLDQTFDAALYEAAQTFADHWLPAPCVCMDLALIQIDGGETCLKIVEFNCINSSGFYDNDINKIVYELTDYVLKL